MTKKQRKKYMKLYRIIHKEEIIQWSKKYYVENRNEILERCKKYNREYKEERKIYGKTYRDSNKDKLKNYRVLYRQRRREYIQKRRKTDINFRLSCYLGIRIRKILKNINKSKSTMKLIGCSINQLKKYLEKRFTKGMT